MHDPLNLTHIGHANGRHASNGHHYFEKARPSIGLLCQNFDNNLNRGILLVYLRNQGINMHCTLALFYLSSSWSAICMVDVLWTACVRGDERGEQYTKLEL